jgi:OOP family OmpA-OmpF porin
MYAAVALVGLAASPVHAANDGFYLGGGIGYYQLDLGNGWDTGDTAFKVEGGYNFAKYFAVDIEWIYGGSLKSEGLTWDLDGWNFSGVGRWPLNEQFDVFAKLGAFMWNADGKGCNFAFCATNEDGTDFSWGLGAGWNATDRVTVNFEYQGFDLRDTNGSELWILTGLYRF